MNNLPAAKRYLLKADKSTRELIETLTKEGFSGDLLSTLVGVRHDILVAVGLIDEALNK